MNGRVPIYLYFSKRTVPISFSCNSSEHGREAVVQCKCNVESMYRYLVSQQALLVVEHVHVAPGEHRVLLSVLVAPDGGKLEIYIDLQNT